MIVNHKEIGKLVQRVKQNDSQAFTILYEKTYQIIYFFALSLTKNEYDAQDVVQETYIKILNCIYTLEDDNLFIAWANRIAYHTIIDMTRVSKDLPVNGHMITDSPDLNINLDPLNTLIQSEEKKRIFQAVQKLDPVLRATIFFKYYQNLKISEIAMIMDCPMGTVKSRLHAARKLLLETMHEDGTLTLFAGMFSMIPLRGMFHDAAGNVGMSSQAAFDILGTSLTNQGLAAQVSFTPTGTAALSSGTHAGVVAAVSATSVATLAVSSLMIISPSIGSITIPKAYVAPAATITIETQSPLPITELYAVAPDGSNIVAEESENGVFKLMVNENGEYEVNAISKNQKQAARTVSVDCIDDTAPEVLSYAQEDEMLRVIFADTQSGLDLSTVYGELPDGTQIAPFSIDTASDSALFSMADDSFMLYVTDVVGNTSKNEVLLKRRTQPIQ